jgi:hypothetical protein
MGVEVELVVGNPGPKEDQLTLTVLDGTGRTMAEVTKKVPTADSDQVLFVIPKDGIEVTPGETHLSSGATQRARRHLMEGRSCRMHGVHFCFGHWGRSNPALVFG